MTESSTVHLEQFISQEQFEKALHYKEQSKPIYAKIYEKVYSKHLNARHMSLYHASDLTNPCLTLKGYSDVILQRLNFETGDPILEQAIKEMIYLDLFFQNPDQLEQYLSMAGYSFETLEKLSKNIEYLKALKEKNPKRFSLVYRSSKINQEFKKLEMFTKKYYGVSSCYLILNEFNLMKAYSKQAEIQKEK